MKKERIYLFDNMKALLVLLVVFGHLLEGITKEPGARELYRIIYSFHMPLFVFCSGYFARFVPSDIVRNLVYPYLVFQALYLAFDRILSGGASLTLTRPYWLLWYLFALTIWKSLLPFFDVKEAGRPLLLAGTVPAALLAGYDAKIGYTLSLSRIIVYFPFFLGAFYLARTGSLPGLLRPLRRLPARLAAFAAVSLASVCILLLRDFLKTSWFLGSYSYEASGSGPLFRMFLYLAGAAWLVFFLSLLPDKKCFLTGIGQNSLYVYLLHGFFVKLAAKNNLLAFTEHKIPAAFLLAVLLTAALSRNFIKKLCAPLTRLPGRFGYDPG